MRDLITKIDPSLWSQMSALVFGVTFMGMLVWVFWPTRKSIYEWYANLPFDNQGKE